MSSSRAGGARHLLKTIHAYSTGLLIVLTCDVLVLAFSLLTLFQARDLTMRYLVRPGAWLTLRVMGVKIAFHGRDRIPDEPVVMIANHISSYDLFAVCALGLPRTRYFLSTYTYIHLPLTLIGLCTGTFYIRGQEDPESRIHCFQRASRILRRTGDSVFLTP